MDKAVTEQRDLSESGRRDTPLDKHGGGASVVNGDPTRLEAPHGVSEKAVVRKWYVPSMIHGHTFMIYHAENRAHYC